MSALGRKPPLTSPGTGRSASTPDAPSPPLPSVTTGRPADRQHAHRRRPRAKAAGREAAACFIDVSSWPIARQPNAAVALKALAGAVAVRANAAAGSKFPIRAGNFPSGVAFMPLAAANLRPREANFLLRTATVPFQAASMPLAGPTLPACAGNLLLQEVSLPLDRASRGGRDPCRCRRPRSRRALCGRPMRPATSATP